MNKLVWNKYQIEGYHTLSDIENRTKTITIVLDIVNDNNFPRTYLHRTVRILDYLHSIRQSNYLQNDGIYILSLVDMYFSQTPLGPCKWLDILNELSNENDFALRQIRILSKLGFDLFHCTYYDCVLNLLGTDCSDDVYDIACFYSEYLLNFSEVRCYNIDGVAGLIVGLSLKNTNLISCNYNEYIMEQLRDIKIDDDFTYPELFGDNQEFIKKWHIMGIIDALIFRLQPVVPVMNKVNRIIAKEMSYRNTLGSGSYGYVDSYKYEGNVIAVKSSRATFGKYDNSQLREIVALSKIKSENIISLLGYMFDNTGSFGIALTLGQMSLDDWIEDSVNPDHDKSVEFGFIDGLIQGVYDMHQAGFAHLDLKPGNVLIVDNAAKICDFGMAVQVDDFCYADDEKFSLGTLKFNPPEAELNLVEDLTPIDVWQVGCIIYYLLVGEDMFARGSVRCSIDHVINIMRVFGTKVSESWLPELDNVDLRAIGHDSTPLRKIAKYLSVTQMGLFVRMFDYDPKKRLTAKELREKWSMPDDYTGPF
jgi:hypothetical protein